MAAHRRRQAAHVADVDALDDPMEVDSSLQSGRHKRESPWATEPPTLEKPGHLPLVPIEKEPPAQLEPSPNAMPAEKSVKSPAKGKPSTLPSAKKPSQSDEMDPEFGSFLEGLE